MTAGNEVDGRLPVWTAFSTLFLDTELSDNDIACIAGVLAASPYEAGALEEILLHEVVPAFGPNLFAIAGEWRPWNEAEVSRIMGEAMAKRAWSRRIARFVVLPVKASIMREWHRIEPLLRKSRGGSDAISRVGLPSPPRMDG